MDNGKWRMENEGCEIRSLSFSSFLCFHHILMASPTASLPLKITHVLNNLGCTSAIKASFIAFGLHKLS
jgi:hypothetical protein